MNDLKASLKKASISLQSDSKKLLIKSEFYFWNKDNIGMLFIGLMGLTAIVLAILKAKDTFSMVFVIVLGVVFVIFTIIGIFKQVSDFVEVSDQKIKFSNSLKRREFLIKPDFKIKVKSSIIRMKTGSSASYFRVVEFFLKTNNGKFRILNYQMYKKDSNEAKELNKEIKKMIKERFTAV